MILGFKQQFPWKQPTYFREKILAGVGKYICDWTYDGHPIIHDIPKDGSLKRNLSFDVDSRGKITNESSDLLFAPKLHTFRADPYNRWKPGMSIQMVYRGPKYSILDHFNRRIPELEVCTGVQEIMLWYTGSLGQFGEDGKRKQIITMHCTIDGRIFENINTLAVNDGFSDQLQFMNWFNKINTPFRGKIIHWTNFRY